MKKIHKQHSDDTSTQQPDEKLAAYLTQVARTINGRKMANGSLALLAPLAASALMPNQINAQACVFSVQIGAQPGDFLLDIDGDGLATFYFNRVNANVFRMGTVGVGSGGENGGISAESVYYSASASFPYARAAGSATQVVNFATINSNNNGGEAIANPGTGNITVIDANNAAVTVNITLGGGAITINSVNGTPPGTCAALPLPIELINFDIIPTEKSLQLSWKTASETNNKGFQIERSTDGAHFRKIGWLAGEGTSEKTNRYTFEDSDIKANVMYYYRLQQVDLDGRTTNSNIVTGKIKGDVAIQFGNIAPNPVRNSLRIEIVSKEESDMTYALYDQLGKLVLQGTNELSQGMNNFKVSVQDVPNGNYYLKMNAGTFSDYKKVVIMK